MAQNRSYVVSNALNSDAQETPTYIEATGASSLLVTNSSSQQAGEWAVKDAKMRWLFTWRFLHPFGWFVFFCVCGPLMLHLLYINLIDPPHGYSGSIINYTLETKTACDIDPVWSSWATIFEVNIRTGYLSFTAAKIIDVAFDLIIGRGGQGILAWISYRVYADVFVNLIEQRSVPYNILTTVTIHPVGASSLTSYIKEMFAKPGIKLTLAWLILTVSYCLSYPTIVSASTSLVAATTFAIELPDTGTAPLIDYVTSAAYKFTNTGLKDQPNPWYVYTRYIHRLPADTPDNLMYLNGTDWSWFDRNDKLLVNSTTFTISNDTKIEDGFYYAGTFYPVDPAKNHGDDTTYKDQLICVPDGQNYQWGASYELLCIIVICQCLWSLAMLWLWAHACYESETLRSGRTIGLYTAILLLAEPLRQKLVQATDGNGLLQERSVENEREVRSIVKTMRGVMLDSGDEKTTEEGKLRARRLYDNLMEQ